MTALCSPFSQAFTEVKKYYIPSTGKDQTPELKTSPATTQSWTWDRTLAIFLPIQRHLGWNLPQSLQHFRLHFFTSLLPSEEVAIPLLLLSNLHISSFLPTFKCLTCRLHDASQLRPGNWTIMWHKIRVSSFLLTRPFYEHLCWCNQQEGIKARSEYL